MNVLSAIRLRTSTKPFLSRAHASLSLRTPLRQTPRFILGRSVLTSSKPASPTTSTVLFNGLGGPGNVILKRTVASTVSGKPASQSFEHAATNIKEEVGNSAADLAKAIAGANVTQDAIEPSGAASFIGITKKVASEVPKPVLIFGLAGALPYLGASATTIYLARNAGLAATASSLNIDPGVALTIFDQALSVQVTYGAVMLSFLGALHWGMEFAGYGGQKGYARLALGAAPVLFAWPTLALQPMVALAAQWLGFTTLWYADSKATMAGWTPKWYSQYRFYLSLLVGSCIIASLAGTSYWGPVAGHGFLSHEVDVLREERKKRMPEKAGLISGPIEALPAGEGADHYVLIHRKESDEKKDEQNDEKKGEEKQETKGENKGENKGEEKQEENEKQENEQEKKEQEK